VGLIAGVGNLYFHWPSLILLSVESGILGILWSDVWSASRLRANPSDDRVREARRGWADLLREAPMKSFGNRGRRCHIELMGGELGAVVRRIFDYSIYSQFTRSKIVVYQSQTTPALTIQDGNYNTVGSGATFRTLSMSDFRPNSYSIPQSCP